MTRGPVFACVMALGGGLLGLVLAAGAAAVSSDAGHGWVGSVDGPTYCQPAPEFPGACR